MGTNRPRHWSVARHASFLHRQVTAEVERLEAEVSQGRRPWTATLARYVASRRELAAQLERDMERPPDARGAFRGPPWPG